MDLSSRWFGLTRCAAVVFATLVGVGCAPTTDHADVTESEVRESARIAPAPEARDVLRDYMALFRASFERAKASHADIQSLTRENLEVFADGEGNLRTSLNTFLRQRPSHEVTIAETPTEFGAWAEATILAAAGPDGKLQDTLAETPSGISNFFSQAKDRLVRDMLRSILQSSAGIDVSRMLDEWTRIEGLADVSFGPYRHPGSVDAAAVKRTLRMTSEVGLSETGMAAVDAFVRALDDAGGEQLDPLGAMWKSSSVRAQYLFEYGEDGIGAAVLAIVDEHGQLFTFSIHYEA